MVICFGISWPINIVKAWKARSTKGISLLFYSFITCSYLMNAKIGLKLPYNISLILGGLFTAAVFAAVIYFGRKPEEKE